MTNSLMHLSQKADDDDDDVDDDDEKTAKHRAQIEKNKLNGT